MKNPTHVDLSLPFYVIDHPTRGFYVGDDWGTSVNIGPRFRWSIMASDKEVFKWERREDANERLATFPIHTQRNCRILVVDLIHGKQEIAA